LTTTGRTKSGGILPVKTSRPIPKELIFDCMKAVNAVTAPDNSRIGDVLVKSILGTDADLVATGNVTPF
ncbi:MAG: DUF1667 domain-containing protein, partial [Clostridia bacterium]|nr:DUF1667 domain-containing protein [Clostridia bacterium]